jgi:hypothetical protein
MSGIINKTGARSGVVGTIVGTPPTFSTTNPEFTGSIRLIPQTGEPISPASRAGTIWIDSDTNLIKFSDGTSYHLLAPDNLTGGLVNQYYSGGSTYRSYTFLTSGTFTTTSAITVDAFVLGGGGGGGPGQVGESGGGGAGGAGAFRAVTSISVSAGSHTVTVGAGGASVGLSTAANNGGDSVFLSTTSNGGAKGEGRWDYNGNTNGNASGGGAPSRNSNTGGAGGTYGNAGGDNDSGGQAGGGGGGAGGAGSDSSGNNGGAGGIGTDNNYHTGSNVTYGVGGTGGSYGSTATSAQSANTGNGGHGEWGGGMGEQTGGSGIVVIRFTI